MPINSRDIKLVREFLDLKGINGSDWYIPSYVYAELVGKVIDGLTTGKAPELDQICANTYFMLLLMRCSLH
jgi:hypothetical protein